MPNKRISQFPSVTTLSNSDIFLINSAGTTSTVSLNTVKDVVTDNCIKLPSPASNNQVLTYNGTNWVANDVPTELPSGTNGQVLTHNGTTWVANNFSGRVSTAHFGRTLCTITTKNVWYSFTSLMSTTWLDLFGGIPKQIDLYVRTGQSALDYTIGTGVNTIPSLSAGANNLVKVNGDFYMHVDNAFDSGNNNHKIFYVTFKLDNNGNFFVKRAESGGGGSVSFIIAGYTVLVN